MAQDDRQELKPPTINAGDIVSQYEIIKKIGEGGMGEVFLARDLQLDRKAALKFLPAQFAGDEDLKVRFKREAQAAARINHPNVVQIYEVGDYKGRPYFAMEYVEGTSLHHYAHQEPQPVKKVLELAIQISEGLSKAHQMGIVHRDIKASNIIVDTDGRPKILDFGLATVQGADNLTQAGSTLGTVAYMSPEQAQGSEVDLRSDLFSLGIVLYELIAGRTPFKRDSTAATLQAIISENPEPLARYKADVPRGLQQIIDKALEKDVEMRYPMAVGLVADLKREKRALESDVTVSVPVTRAARPSRRAGRLTRVIVPWSVVLLAAVLVLVFKPWNLEVRSTRAATTGENRLAVMYFHNLAHPDDEMRLGEIAANLVIADLSESQFIQVVSSQGLYDILKRLGQEGTRQIVRGIDSKIAQQANARWMLLGSILQTEPNLIVTTQLVEVASNNVISSQRVTGQSGETIFSVVDRLTVAIKKELALPSEALQESDPQLVDITTPSAEAYRHYLEGVEYHRQFLSNKARESFEKALEFDSTFAMAYYSLSIVVHEQEKRQQAIDNAIKYIDKVNNIEKQYIMARHARIEGDYDSAIATLEKITEDYPDEKLAYYYVGNLCFEQQDDEKAIKKLLKAVEIDPMLKEGFNQLAYLYYRTNNFEKSLWAINKYIELAPDEPNPYDTRGELFGYHGDLESAIASYETALEKDRRYYASIRNLAGAEMFRRNYTLADSLLQAVAVDPDMYTRALGRRWLARPKIFRGQFSKALHLLTVGAETDLLELGESLAAVHKINYRSYILYHLDRLNEAIAETERARNLLGSVAPDEGFVHLANARLAALYAADGKWSMVDSLMTEVNKYVDLIEATPAKHIQYWRSRGLIEFYRSNYDEAIEYFKESDESSGGFWYLTMIGRSYLESGRIGDAVNTLEQALNRYDDERSEYGADAVKAHYWLGIAYERSGWMDKAVSQYTEFVEIWGDADTKIAELQDARIRLMQIRGRT